MITEYLNKVGDIVETYDTQYEYRIVGKKVVTENLTRFYLKQSSNRILDVLGLNDRQLRAARTKYIEVTSDVYDKYIAYIKNKTFTSLGSIERMISG